MVLGRNNKILIQLDVVTQRILVFAGKFSVNFRLVATRTHRVTESVLREAVGQEFVWNLHIGSYRAIILRLCEPWCMLKTGRIDSAFDDLQIGVLG